MRIPAAVAAVIVLAVASGCGSSARDEAPRPAATGATRAASPAGTDLPGPQPLPSRTSVRAVSVSAPTIGVRSSLVALHLDGKGALVPPADFTHAGWYAAGPAPGDPGPAVIAGHVDSFRGPAVFFRLKELKSGDPVAVTRSDGRVVRFSVISVQRYSKSAFPTAAVYGPVPDAELRLITCGGSFDRAKRSYRDNIVVSATLS